MKLEIAIILICLVIAAVAGCTGKEGEPSNINLEPGINYTAPENGSIVEELANTSSALAPGNYDASGLCTHVVDGDTIDVEGLGRIRLVGVNTPEKGQPGYQEATDFVRDRCLGKTVYLDVDDAKHYDKYGRTLALVYVDNLNLNAELLKKGYAEVMYIPPSEFNPYTWS